jgi:hypothetical protein
MSEEPRPGDAIEIGDRALALVVRQQTRPYVWWALDADGKTHGVRQKNGDDDKWEYAIAQ